MCFSVPVFACLTPFSHSLRSGSIPKGSNLCRLTCHSLSSDRPDGGKNLRGHDDHGVLPAEQNQALAGPPRRAGIAVRRVALSLYLHPTLLKWSAGRRTAPKTAGLFWVAATLVLFQERALVLPGWVGGGGGERPAGGDKNISTNQARLSRRNAALSWAEWEFSVSPFTVFACQVWRKHDSPNENCS